MRDYCNDDWLTTLQENNLNGFDDWWGLEADWFEEPNIRRGGWSGVSRVTLGERTVFLKRQEDHVIRTLAHPFNGIPTFVREMQNILAMQAAAVPALNPVYFAERKVNGKQRAILVTEALEGFSPLDEIPREQLSFSARIKLITTAANVVKQLHAHKLVHNCLYPKHLFVRGGDGGFEVHLIDLEKARTALSRDRAMFRDLDTLNRHCRGWTRSDRLRFLLAYLGVDATKDWRELWQRLASRAKDRISREHRNKQDRVV